MSDETTPPTLRPAREYADAVRAETAALATTAEAAGFAAAVPSCPEWTVSDLLAHIGRVQNWAVSVIERRATEPLRFRDLEKPPEDDAGRLAYVRAVGPRLADALAAIEPGTPIWTFATEGPGAGTAGFWQRRQAHEVAVHRYDAQLAAGTPEPVDGDRAADGIDELLTVMGPRAFAGGLEGPPATLHLHCTDRDGEWLVRFGDGGYEVERAHAKGDVAVRGSASDLFLFAANRRGVDDLEIFGDDSVLVRWRESARM
jgi:uncharacterized protein (TIGR03083 family)